MDRVAIARCVCLLLALLLQAGCVPAGQSPTLSPPDAHAAAPEGGANRPVELSVLTYNTHGLRQRYAKDDPERRFPQIGRLLNGYDVALLQEDFAYHELIAENAEHGIQRRGNPQDRNLIADLLAPIACGECGAGLSTLVEGDESALVGEHREAYEAYHGWFGSRYDAWVTKGFLVVRIRLANGAIVDVYNTHLDAGKKKKRVEDERVRGSQLEQLRAAMEGLSAGSAVILAGDFNYRVDRPRPLLDEFAQALGLQEVAAETVGRWRPRSAHIFHRSSENAAVELLATGEAVEFVAVGGEPLSDHPAIFARFRVRALGP
jgi:endonuclease/exonuclease/phosphatase family metal-dependent hydrolase